MARRANADGLQHPTPATNRRSTVPTSDRHIAKTLRNCRVIAALVCCAFAWVAILTYDPAGWPNPSVWPHANPVSNGCGRAGAWIAYQSTYYLGGGAYILAFLLALAALLQLARQKISDALLRFAGLGLLITATAASIALIFPEASTGLVEGRGGILGIAVANALQSSLSTTGAALTVAAVGVIGLLLMADDVLIRIPATVSRLHRHGLQGLRAAGHAGQRKSALTPVTMGAGSITAGPDPTILVDDDPDELTEEDSLDDEYEDDEDSDAGEEEALEDDNLEDPDEEEEEEDARAPTERELIIRMLGRDRLEGKTTKSAWPTELGDYVLPPLTLLSDADVCYNAAQEGVVREKAAILEATLAEFRIDVHVVEIDTGPVITMFELELAAGIKVSQINSLSNDIARALKAPAVRVVAPLPGKNTIGIEVPNIDKENVRLKELIMLGGVKPTKMALPVFIGKNASGDPLIVDITTMPHMLIAGTTGSGKSVAINSLVMSLLMTQRPDHVKLILVDPKMVELSSFKEIPHLMCPIVTDMQRAELILEWATTKMDERYELLAEAGVRDIARFNRLGKDKIYERFQPSSEQEKLQIPTHLPYIVIIIDELADLMMTSGKEVEHHLSRLAQKSRAVGVHLIFATQRPQANVVTGLVKSNLPCRMAFRVASRMDSRIVLDQNGAEVLMGEGDMLFLPPGCSKLVRAQGTFVEEEEVRAVIKDLAAKAKPEFHHELQRLQRTSSEAGSERDPLFDQAVTMIVETRRGSVSLLQRRLEVGYSRASRLIDQMAAAGIVGEYKGSQAREVLITEKEWAQIRKHRDKDLDEGHYRADLDAEDDDLYGTEDLPEAESASPDNN